MNPSADTPLSALPVLDLASCVHSRSPRASCDACARSCPTDAWTIAGRSPELNAAACDGCGRCTAACPELALTLPGFELTPINPTTLIVACDRAEAPPGGASRPPCLHALGLADLARTYDAGVRMVHTLAGDCGACSRGPGETLQDRLALFNAMLAARVAEPLQYTSDPASIPTAVPPASAQPGGGRRAFFRTLVRDPVRAFSTGGPPPKPLPPADSAQAGKLLARVGQGPLPHAPTLFPHSCTFCMACVRLCPHGALQLHRQGTEPGSEATLFIAAAACTGCRLCEDVCDDGAIRITDWSIARQARIELRLDCCPGCGAPYHRRADIEPDPAAPAGLCPVCARTRHAARLHQVLDD